MIKQLHERFKSPTPWKWRKIGESIRHLGFLITGNFIFNNRPDWSLVALVFTWLGETLVNFATEDTGSN